MKRFSIFASACFFAVLALAGCKADVATPTATSEFTLHFENTVGTAPLVLNAGAYTNANGDAFTVSTFKYYISNVTLNKADNSSYTVPNSYFLIDQANAASQDVTMKNVPVGDYTSLTFTIGVDSTRTKAGNFSGGVLDANNNMYWDMNGPEFINLKMEGSSAQALPRGLVFHIAGYKHATTNTIRTVTLSFPVGVNLLVRPDHSPEIHTQADVAQMFTGPNVITTPAAPFRNPVNFASVNTVMGGPAAAKIANNIAIGMFSVEHIHAN